MDIHDQCIRVAIIESATGLDDISCGCHTETGFTESVRNEPSDELIVLDRKSVV